MYIRISEKIEKLACEKSKSYVYDLPISEKLRHHVVTLPFKIISHEEVNKMLVCEIYIYMF